MTTSALRSLSRAGQATTGPAASASRSHQLRCRPGVSALPVRFKRAAVSDAGTRKVCQLSCARLEVVAPSNVSGLLDRGANDHPALIIPDRVSLTYARLCELTDEAAHSLASHGVGMNDRVAIVYPNGPEAILLFLAASMVATACPLNPAYKEDEFRFYLEHVGARFLLVPPGEAEAARRAIPAGAKVIEANIDVNGRLQMNGEGQGKRRHSLDLSSAADDRSSEWRRFPCPSPFICSRPFTSMFASITFAPAGIARRAASASPGGTSRNRAPTSSR